MRKLNTQPRCLGLASLKQAAVTSINIRRREKNPHVRRCAATKQHSGTRRAFATPTSQLKCLFTARHEAAHWFNLTRTVLCGMCAAGVSTVSLIYQDKRKHVKSKDHSAGWQGGAYHKPFHISGVYDAACGTLSSICSDPLCRFSASRIKVQHSPLWSDDSDGLQCCLNVRGRRVSGGSRKPLDKCYNTHAHTAPLLKCVLNKDVFCVHFHQGSELQQQEGI